jgi:signal transduction histidine kinase
VDAELNELFRHLTDAFTTRMSIPVQLRIEGTHPLPAEVKVALYRIAQEALNNVAKHAHASQVELLIQCDEEGVQLSVWDDGSGFDPSQVSPESLGLGIMWERAEGIGADLSINSHPGGGTEISVVWKENTI